jgi:hypothetical protein
VERAVGGDHGIGSSSRPVPPRLAEGLAFAIAARKRSPVTGASHFCWPLCHRRIADPDNHGGGNDTPHPEEFSMRGLPTAFWS